MCFVPVTMTSLSASSEGSDRPKFVLASAYATLTLSRGASVVNMLCSVNGQAAVLGAGVFFSGQDCCVLCQQFVVQMSRYTRALGQGWTTGARAVCQWMRKGGGQTDGDG